jgi:hypothetical protein
MLDCLEDFVAMHPDLANHPHVEIMEFFFGYLVETKEDVPAYQDQLHPGSPCEPF